MWVGKTTWQPPDGQQVGDVFTVMGEPTDQTNAVAFLCWHRYNVDDGDRTLFAQRLAISRTGGTITMDGDPVTLFDIPGTYVASLHERSTSGDLLFFYEIASGGGT